MFAMRCGVGTNFLKLYKLIGSWGSTGGVHVHSSRKHYVMGAVSVLTSNRIRCVISSGQAGRFNKFKYMICWQRDAVCTDWVYQAMSYICNGSWHGVGLYAMADGSACGMHFASRPRRQGNPTHGWPITGSRNLEIGKLKRLPKLGGNTNHSCGERCYGLESVSLSSSNVPAQGPWALGHNWGQGRIGSHSFIHSII